MLFLILLPGTLFLFWFLWHFLRRGVIDPIEDLERVARAVARGDYSRRLQTTGRRDEIGRLVVVMNRMLGLLEEYRDSMEAKVGEKTREIERKNRELMLAQRLAATGTLAAGIAHEINNPLGGMLNATRRLRRPDLTAEQREKYVVLLEECIGRIGDIVQRVLSLSPRKASPARLDLAGEIRKAAELVAHRAQRKNVAVRVDSLGPHPVIAGEANEIGQIFLNLLINGVDACREGGQVEVRVRQEPGWAVAEVEDDGVGMEPDVAAQAFDMFFTTKPAGEGTGLGLATVHTLVLGYGGTLDLRTEPGHGTRFTVKLPLLPGEGPSGGEPRHD
jgi:signal transduction histidine kinase